MTIIADWLLFLAALGAAFYCRVLANRLRALNNMDTGVGNAIATLSERVDSLQTTLSSLSDQTAERAARIEALTQEADAASRRMELLLASLHEPQYASPRRDTTKRGAGVPGPRDKEAADRDQHQREPER